MHLAGDSPLLLCAAVRTCQGQLNPTSKHVNNDESKGAVHCFCMRLTRSFSATCKHNYDDEDDAAAACFLAIIAC